MKLYLLSRTKEFSTDTIWIVFHFGKDTVNKTDGIQQYRVLRMNQPPAMTNEQSQLPHRFVGNERCLGVSGKDRSGNDFGVNTVGFRFADAFLPPTVPL
jgi:hypothetical protein